MNCWFCGCENLPGSDVCERCHEDLARPDFARIRDPIERDLLQRQLGQLKTSEYLEVAPEGTLRSVVEQFRKSGSHCALVTKQGRLEGILTERDLLLKVADRLVEFASRPVCDFMTANPATLPYDAPVAFALNRMMVGGYRHVPIMRDDKPVGLVSIRDILRYLVERFPETIGAPAAI